MRYKVIFDTNSIRNAESEKQFLGGRSDLERFAKVSDIIIPDIVVEEIISQKNKHFSSKKAAFLSNPFHSIMGLDIDRTKNCDIEAFVLKLAEEEPIPYTTITMQDKNILTEIKDMCLRHSPPFEENSDKGFKDTCIYFIVKQYLERQEGEKVFLVSQDERLQLAFNNDDRIRVVENYDEFEKYIDEYFKDPYFIERLREEISPDIAPECYEDSWLNVEENWVIRLKCGENKYYVEVDFSSKEIIGSIDRDFSDPLSRLVSSGSFSSTHSSIEELKGYVRYLSNQDIQNLIKAACDNSQIYSISTDEDVKEFFLSLYEAKLQILSDEIRDRFEFLFDVKKGNDL